MPQSWITFWRKHSCCASCFFCVSHSSSSRTKSKIINKKPSLIVFFYFVTFRRCFNLSGSKVDSQYRRWVESPFHCRDLFFDYDGRGYFNRMNGKDGSTWKWKENSFPVPKSKHLSLFFLDPIAMQIKRTYMYPSIYPSLVPPSPLNPSLPLWAHPSCQFTGWALYILYRYIHIHIPSHRCKII